LRRKGRIHWCKTRTLLPHRSLLHRTADPYAGSASADIDHAAVNDDLAADAERRFVRGEKDHRLRNLARTAHTACRDLGQEQFALLFGLAVMQRRCDWSRADRINTDAVPMSSPESVRAIEAMPAVAES
jgi:hypothetical protein